MVKTSNSKELSPSINYHNFLHKGASDTRLGYQIDRSCRFSHYEVRLFSMVLFSILLAAEQHHSTETLIKLKLPPEPEGEEIEKKRTLDSPRMADATLEVLKYTAEKVSAAAENSSSETQATFVVIDQDLVTGKKSRSIAKLLSGKARVINGFDDDPKDEPLPGSKWSFCRVPTARHEADERAPYVPLTVSIGPIHYKKSGTEMMEAQKSRFLDRLLERYSDPSSRHKAIQDAMRGLEARTRKCYSEEFPNIDSDGFTTMMLLDGCFQIELFRLNGRRFQGKLADDPIFETNWMPIYLARDMLLLENQLPLFVLQELYELTRSSGDEQASLNELALHFFEPLRPGKDAVEIGECDRHANKPHLLALFHSSFSPSAACHPPARKIKRVNKYNKYSGKCWFYNAKLLKNCGVKFRRKSGNIFDLAFKNKKHALQIPTLFIDESTSLVLRNLVAYEQSDRRVAAYFMSLVVFFSNLLHSPIDAGVLMQAGIIRQTNNNSTQVVDLFCSLAEDLIGFDMNNCYLHQLVDDVNIYSRSKRARARAFIKKVNLKLRSPEIIVILLTFAFSFLTFRGGQPSVIYVHTPSPSPTPIPTPSPSPTPSPNGGAT